MSKTADALTEAWEFFGGDYGGPDFNDPYDWNLAHRWLVEFQEFQAKLRDAGPRELDLLIRHGKTHAIQNAARAEVVRRLEGGESPWPNM